MSSRRTMVADVDSVAQAPTLDLTKIRTTGFGPEDARDRLARQLSWME